MQGSKWLAIGLCILFVLGAYAAWNYAFSQFNPNPVSTTLATTYSCASTGPCGEFQIVSVNVTLQGGEAEITNGIQSQSLSLQLDVLGQASMSSVQVFVNGTSIGSENGPFRTGISKALYFPVPTTISVNPGEVYSVTVEGTFPGGAAGGPPISYLQSIDVVATG